MRVNLTAEEMYVCRTIGLLRQSDSMYKSVDAEMGKDMDKFTIHMDGVVAEFCVAKVLNLCPDFDTKFRVGGSDLISRKGQTIDVKSTRHKDGKLLAKIGKVDKQSDLYIFTIVDNFGCDIIGWTSKENLFKEENKTSFGYNICYALEQSQLQPFKKSTA